MLSARGTFTKINRMPGLQASLKSVSKAEIMQYVLTTMGLE